MRWTSTPVRSAAASVAALALAALGLTGCAEPEADDVAAVVPDEVAADGTLLAVTDATFPPAQLRAPRQLQGVQRGELTGFEVELLEAVADALGLDVAWVDVPFDEVIEQVGSGRAEVGAAAITITDERRDALSFVPFFRTGVQWAARVPNPSGVTPGDPCGARVAVQEGTVQEDDLAGRSAACTQAGEEPVQILRYERQDQVTAAVVTGVAEAFLADAPAVRWAIRQSVGSRAAAGTAAPGRLAPVGERYDEAPYGWAVTDDDLAAALLDGLRTVVETGDYDDILRAWGVADGALDPSELTVLARRTTSAVAGGEPVPLR